MLLSPSEVPTSGPVLALALRLSAASESAPLEQVWIWTSFLALLNEPSHEDGVRRERERLAVRGDESAIAAVQLLWHDMTRGSAGHARLRYVLCDVWRCLFDVHPPGCLDFSPQPIGCEQLSALPSGWTPLHAMRRRKIDAAAARRAAALPKTSLKTTFYMNDVLGLTRDRHSNVTGRQSRRPWKFVSAFGEDEKHDTQWCLAVEEEHKRRAEERVTFKYPLA